MVLAQLQSLIAGAGIPAPSRMTGAAPTGFPKTLTLSDFSLTAGGVAVVTGKFQTVGTFEIGAQQRYRWGYGGANNPQNQGYIYLQFKIYGTSTDYDGVIRLVQANAQETVRLVVFEERTEELDGDANDKAKRIPLPEQTQFPMIGEDSKMIIEFKPDAAGSVSELASETIIRLPATVYQ